MSAEKEFIEIVQRYHELQHSRGLSDEELERVTAWMSDIIVVMMKHSSLCVDAHGPRWEHIQSATLEMFRWFVEFEKRSH